MQTSVLNKKEQLIYEILSILQKEETSMLGSSTLSAMFNEKGLNIGEATIGRLLRELDQKKYTQKNGFKGRTLLDGGKEYFKELENKIKSHDLGRQFTDILKTKNQNDLREVLIARRAIEGELAYLCVENIKQKDIIELEKMLKEQEEFIKQSKSIANIDKDFHIKIASIAKNKLLETSLSIIREDTNLSPVFDYIRRYIHGSIYTDHKNIVDSIKSKDPEKAKSAIISHINNIIKDIDNYWQFDK